MHCRLPSIEPGSFFFQPAQLHLEPTDLLVQFRDQGVLVLGVAAARSENSSVAPSNNRFFHCPICDVWTPKAETSWLVVRSPRTAASATFAFTPASIRRRFAM